LIRRRGVPESLRTEVGVSSDWGFVATLANLRQHAAGGDTIALDDIRGERNNCRDSTTRLVVHSEESMLSKADWSSLQGEGCAVATLISRKEIRRQGIYDACATKFRGFIQNAQHIGTHKENSVRKIRDV
jgi:hypothetical protein